MAKFEVRIVKTVHEECWLVIEAVDEKTAYAEALKRAQDDENQEWFWKEIFDYDVIAIEELEEPQQAAE